MTAGRWERPIPTIGDRTAAVDRASAPDGWAFSAEEIAALDRVIGARRDIRRYRPDAVDDRLVREVIEAGHGGPSVGHSQPWRFIVVREQRTRDIAAAMADAERVRQAAAMTPERGQRLLDLQLEGIREAPVGVVVACDRRTPALGVLGRATFADADLWSCACAIENMWLAARARGLGMGWVTLFQPAELASLLGLPEGVETLGWLCLGWPDERPPSPGLERRAWSKKLPLDEVILAERWPASDVSAPISHLAAPEPQLLVGARDQADQLLTPPGSLGLLDTVLDRVVASGGGESSTGTLILVGADHPVTAHDISAFATSVTRQVLEASVVGESVGASLARATGLGVRVVDAGVEGELVAGAVDARVAGVRGDLVKGPAMSLDQVTALVEHGRRLGREAAAEGLVCLGEVGVGNTTVAAALAASLLGLTPEVAVGIGAAADSDMVARKQQVVAAALARTQPDGPLEIMAEFGGPELAVLTGVTLGACERGVVVLDGLATSVAALAAVRLDPGCQGRLVAGMVSREGAHRQVLQALGLEPLLQLRLRAGEGAGAVMATQMILNGLQMRRTAGRVR